MKSIFRVSLVVLTVAFALSTCFADAAADYKAKCATCHGPDGKGDTAMGKTMKVKDLGSADVQKQSLIAYLISTLTTIPGRRVPQVFALCPTARP